MYSDTFASAKIMKDPDYLTGQSACLWDTKGEKEEMREQG
jgi:hypothetical protein